MIRDFMGERIALVYVDALPADAKYAFLDGVAFNRVITGDHQLKEREIAAQEEFKTEAQAARELERIPETGLADLDLDKLNQFIYRLNQPRPVETIKPTLDAAVPFLTRKSFIKDGVVTTLGMLVCGKNPGDKLDFRCHLHGYVDAPQEVARDKQDFIDNVLQLMDAGLGYVLRNIQVGVSAEGGGKSTPQYPEDVLRETVNNALAHRDYSVNKQAIITIKPNVHVRIQNPGRFRRHLLIEVDGAGASRLRRIIPEAKPTNPKLADVLRVYRKWEGRGIGMSTLVSMCLEDRMDLPYYQLFTEEVALSLQAGQLLDARMQALFESFDGYLESKLGGAAPTTEEKLVLAYLLKSEWANQDNRYTILLTPDNNHQNAIRHLESAGLVSLHPSASTPTYPVYLVDRALAETRHGTHLRELLGDNWTLADVLEKEVLSVAYQYTRFSRAGAISARQAAYSMWYGAGKGEDIKAFDLFYRRVQKALMRLAKRGLLVKSGNSLRLRYCVPKVPPAY